MEITDYLGICSILPLASHYLLKINFYIFIYVFISSVNVQLNHIAVFALKSAFSNCCLKKHAHSVVYTHGLSYRSIIG